MLGVVCSKMPNLTNQTVIAEPESYLIHEPHAVSGPGLHSQQV